ncbi:MAG: CRTAC1 family protein [Chitinophagales bacterium]
MSKKTKRILIVIGILFLVGVAGAYFMRGKIKKYMHKGSHKRVAAQQSAKVRPIAWDPTKSGNQAMIDYLNQVYDLVNKPGLRFMNTAIVEDLLKKPIPQDPEEKFQWYFDVCNQLINCGRVNDAILRINEFESSPQFKEVKNKDLGNWYFTKGLVYLRFGEVENCIGMHNPESCIWPLSVAAQSQMKEGPNKAIEAFTKCLQYQKENLNAMWLMNIAYMQVGGFPDQVPQQWLIPPSSFKSEYEVPRFKNVAIDLGVDYPNMCGGIILDDFNRDGLADIFTCGWGLKEQCYFLLNRGDGTFEDITEKAGLKNYPGGLYIQQTDYNNDGLLDVWISRGAWYSQYGIVPSSMLRNNGDSTFTDVTYEIGLWSVHPTQASTWADFNNDGWLDLYIGCEASRKGDKVNDCELFLNDHGKFKNVAKEAGVNINTFVKGVTSGDYDNDGDADIYVSANGFKNFLFRNDTKKGSMQLKFTDVTKEAGVTGPKQSFPCWFYDYNNDGWLDIINFSYSASASDNDIPAEYMNKPRKSDHTALYINNHDGTFTDRANDLGLNRTFLVMGCSYGDFDLDGWQDFYVGTGKPDMRSLTPNRMFRNAEGKGYQDVTTAAGVGVLQKGHEISFGDLNNDGYPELFVQMGGAYEASGFYDCLFENPASFGNNFVAIDLVGTTTNKIARGARVKVTVMENGKERDIYDWVTSGSSFGANTLRLEMGLGKATEIKKIEIQWPASGTTQTITGVALNTFIRITEGNDQFEVLDLHPFLFRPDPEKSYSHHMMMTMDEGNDRYMHMK